MAKIKHDSRNAITEALLGAGVNAATVSDSTFTKAKAQEIMDRARKNIVENDKFIRSVVEASNKGINPIAIESWDKCCQIVENAVYNAVHSAAPAGCELSNRPMGRIINTDDVVVIEWDIKFNEAAYEKKVLDDAEMDFGMDELIELEVGMVVRIQDFAEAYIRPLMNDLGWTLKDKFMIMAEGLDGFGDCFCIIKYDYNGELVHQTHMQPVKKEYLAVVGDWTPARHKVKADREYDFMGELEAL